MNLIKKIPLMAFISGLGLIAGMSSFKDSNKLISGYGFYTGPTIPGTGVVHNSWYDYNTPPSGYKSVCNTSLDACTRSAASPTAPKLSDGQFSLEEL